MGGDTSVSRRGAADGGDELVCGRGLEQESAGPDVQGSKTYSSRSKVVRITTRGANHVLGGLTHEYYVAA
jgi:hypothetical protein